MNNSINNAIAKGASKDEVIYTIILENEKNLERTPSLTLESSNFVKQAKSNNTKHGIRVMLQLAEYILNEYYSFSMQSKGTDIAVDSKPNEISLLSRQLDYCCISI